ncbi:MAG: nucleotidyltransferase family protein [Bacteroidales bacterium]|nr:nucleotidyltransferase family protein [Bacteroidales bacterium]
MTNTADSILALLRIAKYGGEESVMISDYGKLYEESMRQKVAYVVLYALRKAHLLDACDEQVRYTWLAQAMIQQQVVDSDTRAIEGLAELYARHGLRMVVLKGRSMATYYPNEVLRNVGDIDIALLDAEGSMDEAWKVGDKAVEQALGHPLDYSHEHHTVFQYKGRPVENHYDIVSARMSPTARYVDGVLKGLLAHGCTPCKVGSSTVLLPCATFNAIFIIRHMAQHFAGSHILLRHLLDWAWFLDKEHESVDWHLASEVWQRCGMTDFVCAVNAICVRYLGVPEAVFHGYCSNDEALVQRVLDDILYSPVRDWVAPRRCVLLFRLRRFFATTWKRRLVYKETLLTQLWRGGMIFLKVKRL